MTDEIHIRYATKADTELVLDFIRALASFERLADQVQADSETLMRQLFDADGPGRCLLAYSGETPVGFALFFFNFSTFLGRKGIYIEDLFVLPKMRSKGIGGLLLQRLAKIAAEKGCGRLEWAVLDWNQRAIEFYESLGAQPQKGWTVYRLEGEALGRLAGN